MLASDSETVLSNLTVSMFLMHILTDSQIPHTYDVNQEVSLQMHITRQLWLPSNMGAHLMQYLTDLHFKML